IEGNGRRFSDMDISGKLGLKDLTIVHEAVGTPFNVNGELHFSQGGAEAKALSVVLGQSTAEIGFKISAAGDRSVESVSFSGDLGLDLGDLFSNLKVNDLSIRGKLKARIEGSGRPALLTGLFPSGERRLSPEEITSAWRQVTLEGRVDVDGVALSMKGNLLHVSSLRAGADIARGSVDNVRAEFCLNGSPFRCSASFKRVMPAVAGLAMMIGDDRSGRSPRTLRKVLDSIEIVPDISFDLSGRSLDTRVLGMPLAGEESRKGQAGAGRTGRRKGAAGGEAAPSFAENPLTLLLLKNSTFKARLDSVITPKAVLTDIEAVGTIRSGRARIDPLSLRYAGGKGTGNLGIDLRNPDRVRTKANLSFEEIDAGRALASLHGLGSVVEGRFAFESKGELVSGPGLNPLVTLGAAGSASSSKGRVSISHFISPLSGEIGLDLSRFERFDFDEWSGSFLIDKGRFITDDWKIRSRKGDWSIRGFFGLDGTLDYAVRLLIPPAQQKEMKDLKKYRDLVELLKDRNGNLVLDFHIGGTASSPKLSIDLSGAKERAGEKLIDGLKKKAKDWLKK
ncbi:MAG: hypothetical protein KAX38_07975, partial [Candidatus Krumholzibacteria bacterium]|nr:hypothetical protein [Candidatus Krumholzibacteria bacterium]